MKLFLYLAALSLVLAIAGQSWAGDTIPKAAWRRPLGLPLDKAGVTRVPGNIDDGYWQGALVTVWALEMMSISAVPITNSQSPVNPVRNETFVR